MSALQLTVAHTADLNPDDLAAARSLLFDTFDDMAEDDWEHCLGGMHALLWDDRELVGHASVVQRRLLHNRRALRTGHVEAVAVRAGRRRQGHGGAVMAEIERIIRGAYDLGALGATDEAVDFYRSRGWLQWEGRTSVITPWAIERTPDDDGNVFVLPVTAELDLRAELSCDWRDGDVW